MALTIFCGMALGAGAACPMQEARLSLIDLYLAIWLSLPQHIWSK